MSTKDLLFNVIPDLIYILIITFGSSKFKTDFESMLAKPPARTLDFRFIVSGKFRKRAPALFKMKLSKIE